MCGRYTLIALPDESKLAPSEAGDKTFSPRYNIAPTQMCPIVPMYDPGHIHLYRWGLMPHWAKDLKASHKMINARAETLDSKPAFKESLASRRCLVFADGFYEWKQTLTGKQPYRIQLASEEVFTFAGLTDIWQAPDGKWIRSFTIITTEPNELMIDIHDRMPAILDADASAEWMNPETIIPAAQALLKPFDAKLMKAYPVSPSVGNVRIDKEQLIRRFEPPPSLF